MLGELWPKLPRLRHVLVIGDDVPPGMGSFRQFLDSPWEDRYSATDLAALRPDPNRVATLMFTSGTEANPKGVMHTHNTMGTATRQVQETYDLSADDVIFMASPIGHTTALIVGARQPVMYGMTTVWQEHWNPATVACVAMPEPVLAERVCAFVICQPGEILGFDEMVAFLKDQRIAAWKLPERLELRAAFPMPPSGKIQKHLLREEIARLLGQKALIR